MGAAAAGAGLTPRAHPAATTCSGPPLALRGGDGSKRALSSFESVRESCRKFTTEYNAVTVGFTVSRLKVRTGADSASARLRGTARGGPADGKQLTLDLVLTPGMPGVRGAAPRRGAGNCASGHTAPAARRRRAGAGTLPATAAPQAGDGPP
ncbi:hypothetical protein [Streptomyces sp. B15]|uniref:hypothetical protein n=1 Tax=Streptomyces sp. B15 TaxID=1537797 RepID=UPI001B376C27|nr:hypothetical protein [Streptomyces sp. B15]MBQ1123072.1 hypothetical protein [Streptomyces sp. B15]